MNRYQFFFVLTLTAIALAVLAWLGVFSSEFAEGFLTFWRVTLGYLEERPDTNESKHVFGEMVGCASLVGCIILGMIFSVIVGSMCEEFYRFLGRDQVR